MDSVGCVPTLAKVTVAENATATLLCRASPSEHSVCVCVWERDIYKEEKIERERQVVCVCHRPRVREGEKQTEGNKGIAGV